MKNVAMTWLLLVMSQTKSSNNLLTNILDNYQANLKQPMKGINFLRLFFVILCACNKVSNNHCGSCIDSPKWIKNKKSNNELKK